MIGKPLKMTENIQKKLLKTDSAIFFHNYGFPGSKKMVKSISRKKFWVEIIDSEVDYKTTFVKPLIDGKNPFKAESFDFRNLKVKKSGKLNLIISRPFMFYLSLFCPCLSSFKICLEVIFAVLVTTFSQFSISLNFL